MPFFSLQLLTPSRPLKKTFKKIVEFFLTKNMRLLLPKKMRLLLPKLCDFSYQKKVFETFKIESLKKANFDHCVSRPLGEKLLKNLFCQKWWLLKTLKFENFKKVNFAHL